MNKDKTQEVGVNINVREKQRIRYTKMMVECIFEEVCRDAVPTEEVEEYIDKASRREVIKEISDEDY